MKKSVILLALFITVQLFAAEKSQISVKDTTVSNGVVLVTIQESGKTYDLQCTQSAPMCAAPRAGTYWMVRLPKNHGIYDCDNVDLYSQSADPDSDQALGEYCLNQK